MIPKQPYEFLADNFSLNELRMLCDRLGIRYEDLGGENDPADKARKIQEFMLRRKRLGDLLDALSHLRYYFDPEPYVYLLLSSHIDAEKMAQLCIDLKLDCEALDLEPVDLRPYDNDNTFRQEKAIALHEYMAERKRLGDLLLAMKRLEPRVNIDAYAKLTATSNDHHLKIIALMIIVLGIVGGFFMFSDALPESFVADNSSPPLPLTLTPTILSVSSATPTALPPITLNVYEQNVATPTPVSCSRGGEEEVSLPVGVPLTFVVEATAVADLEWHSVQGRFVDTADAGSATGFAVDYVIPSETTSEDIVTLKQEGRNLCYLTIKTLSP